jgi:hypothetical protein
MCSADWRSGERKSRYSGIKNIHIPVRCDSCGLIFALLIFVEQVPAVDKTKEKTMNSVETFVQSSNDPSNKEIRHSSAGEVEKAKHHVRNMIILSLALEFAFLATLAAYEFSSIFRYQN